MAVPIYNYLMDELEEPSNGNIADSIKPAVEFAFEKLKHYYWRTDASVYTISTGTFFIFFNLNSAFGS
jgi:hypothetical protein